MTRANAMIERLPGRLLVSLGMLELTVSLALLLIASTGRERLPSWAGPVDGVIAFLVVATLALVHARSASRVEATTLRASQTAMTVIVPGAFVLLWLFRDRLDWNILMPGLAWRSFVVLSGLPLSLAAWRLRSPAAR